MESDWRVEYEAKTKDKKLAIKKEYDDIIRKWKSNDISLVDGACALVRLGFGVNQAWDILQRT